MPFLTASNDSVRRRISTYTDFVSAGCIPAPHRTLAEAGGVDLES